MSRSSACIACDRFHRCESYAMVPLLGGNYESLDVLVIGESPSPECDTLGVPMSDIPFLELVRGPLQKTPWRCGYTHMTRCWDDGKPTAKQLDLCYKEFLQPFIGRTEPRVIWAIGANVARKLLNSSMTLDKIRSMGVGYTEDGIPVVVLESPRIHSKYMSVADGGKDLRHDYKKKIELTHKILTGVYKPEVFEFTTIRTFAEAMQMRDALHHDCYLPVGFDTEVGLQSGANFCEQSERVNYLTSGFSAMEKSSGNYLTFSVDHEDWEKQEVYKMLFHTLKGRIPFATQCFFDFGLVWWQAGFDIFRVCEVYHDIHLLGWAQNQTGLRNGLEEQCVDILGWAGWKAALDELKHKAEQEFVAGFDSLVEHADYRHIKWMFPEPFLKYQAKDALGTAKLAYEHYLDPESNYLELKPKYDINGYRLARDYVKPLSYMSRHGVPINVETVKAYQAVNQKTIDHYDKWISQHPITAKLFDGELNTKSGPQMHKLCLALKIDTKEKTPKTLQSKVDQDELLRQSNCQFTRGKLVKGVRSDDRAKKIAQDFFYAILQSRLNRDKNSKSQGLVDYAQPHGHWQNRDGQALQALHPFFKVGKLVSGFDSKGGGGQNTGRISSVWPAMANVSKEEMLRAGFEAPSGYVIAEWDLSAIEPRVFAYLAGEESWKRVFEMQADPLTASDPAADIYRQGWSDYKESQSILYPPGMVTEDERDDAKVLILRLCYDSSPNGITRQDGIPLALTTAFAEGFWKRYTSLQAFAYATRKKIIQQGGWLTSAAGSRAQYKLYNTYLLDDDIHWDLPLWKLQKELRIGESDAEKLRAGMNSEIQGTANHINMTFIKELVDHLFANKIKWLAPFNAVHDSMWAVVDERYLKEADALVTGIQTDSDRIQDRYGINVPFPRSGHRILRNTFKVGYHMGAMKNAR